MATDSIQAANTYLPHTLSVISLLYGWGTLRVLTQARLLQAGVLSPCGSHYCTGNDDGDTQVVHTLHQSQIFFLVNYTPSFHARQREAGGNLLHRMKVGNWRLKTSSWPDLMYHWNPYFHLSLCNKTQCIPGTLIYNPCCSQTLFIYYSASVQKYFHTNCPHNDSFDIVHLKALLTRISEIFMYGY